MRTVQNSNATGKEVDLGGYFRPDLIASNKIMKPSPIFNEIINNLYSVN